MSHRWVISVHIECRGLQAPWFETFAAKQKDRNQAGQSNIRTFFKTKTNKNCKKIFWSLLNRFRYQFYELSCKKKNYPNNFNDPRLSQRAEQILYFLVISILDRDFNCLSTFLVWRVTVTSSNLINLFKWRRSSQSRVSSSFVQH
jgi:hypothetical protein